MTDLQESGKVAPETITVIWCPECGRDNRVTPLRANHYSGGRRCPGAPVELVYRLERP